MSRLWKRIFSGVTIVENDDIMIDNFEEPTRNNFDLIALGGIQRNVWAGGTELDGIPGDTAGDFKLYDWQPLYFDNTSDQWGFAGSPPLTTVTYTFLVRVSNAALTVTPKIWYAADIATLISGPTVASIAGEAACVATNADYSGTDQIQEVSVTVPSGAKYWMAGVTLGGVPAAGYQAWARAFRDVYVAS